MNANYKILLVDDEDEFVSTLAERLEMRGYAANVAYDGEEALESIENEMPAVVVLDIKMPGLNGIEVLKRLLNLAPGLPVLLLTGYGSTEEGMQGMQIGAFDYMMKPLNIDDLIKKMEEAISAKS